MRAIDQITEIIIGAAIAVHRELGPGLLESAYEACLAFEVAERGLEVARQVELPVAYRAVRLDCGYRLDLLIEKQVVVEVKAIEQVVSVHEAQILSYLRLSGCQVGLLINFNVRQLSSGVKRFVHNLQE